MALILAQDPVQISHCPRCVEIRLDRLSLALCAPADAEPEDPGYDCLLCDHMGTCVDHYVKHLVLKHPGTVDAREGLLSYAKDMVAEGRWTVYTDLDHIVTEQGVFPNHYRSAYLEMAQKLGLQHPCIISLDKPPRDTIVNPEAFAQYIRETEWNLSNTGLQLNAWTGSSSHTYFCSAVTAQPFLTETGADSLSGFVNSPAASPGNARKRNRVLSEAELALAHPKPTAWPWLSIDDGAPLRCYRMNTGKAGDGGGAIKFSALQRLIKAGGGEKVGDIVSIYVVATGRWSFKAELVVHADHRFPTHNPETGLPLPKDVSVIIDDESFNEDLYNFQFTLLKGIPKRHKANERFIKIEPLFLGEAAHRFLDPSEVNQQAMLLTQELDARVRQILLRDQHDSYFGNPYAESTPSSYDWQKALKALRQQEEVETLYFAYQAAGKSPFANPQVLSRIAGKYARQWQSHLERGRELPTRFVYGEHLKLLHPFYAGHLPAEPETLRLIWHPRKRDELIGVGLHPETLRRESESLGTPDTDDTVYVIFLEDPSGQAWGLVLRLPSSPDGGICQKLNPADARRLRALGYHFYRKQEGHQFPGLYALDAAGQPVYPNQLESLPFPEDQTPFWTTNPYEAVKALGMLDVNWEYMGEICNALAALDYSGHFDPETDKLEFSVQVIDPVQKATSDPTNIAEALYERLYQTLQGGKRIDPCILGRVLAPLQEIHAARQLENPALPDFDALLNKPGVQKCAPHHPVLKAGAENALQKLQNQLENWRLLANGPHRWLLKDDYPEALASQVRMAFKEISQQWGTAVNQQWEILRDKQTPYSQRKAKAEKIMANAGRRQDTLIQKAYRRAIALLRDDYQPGSFMGFWRLHSLTNDLRYHYDRKRGRERFKAASSNALEQNLPAEEREAYYGFGKSKATILLQVRNRVRNLYPGARCKLRRIKGNPDLYSLGTPAKGNPFGEVAAFEGKTVAGFSLKVLGEVPNYWPPRNELIRPTEEREQPWIYSETGERQWNPYYEEANEDDESYQEDQVQYKPVDLASYHLVAFEVILE